MAKRYRYAIIKKKESSKGKLSVGLAIASLLLFVAAVITASQTTKNYLSAGKWLEVWGSRSLKLASAL